jgi:hypothetical protein
MDGQRFDELSRDVTARIPRRAWVVALAGGLLSTLAPALGGDRIALAAKKKGKTKGNGKKKANKSRFLAKPMTHAQEVAPTVGDPTRTGSASFTIEGTKVCGLFTLSAASSTTVTGTHIHKGAAGVNGAIVVDFNATIGKRVCVNAGSIASQIKRNPAGFYANIHTGTHPDGAVRGQLRRV